MKQYVKYLRKSRFDRDYGELSIEETLKRHDSILTKMANDCGYHIAKTYYEVVSGESIAARPEIQKMLDEVSAGLYEGVLVVDVERLARGNGADQAYISQVFQFSGTKIITPTKIYDPTNEYDEEYFEFGLFMSRREYKTINRRLIRGRQSSASEGKYLGSIAPYGYRRIKLVDEKGYSLEPHPEEADVVKRIFELYLNQSGTKEIANYLNDRDIPTRHGDLWTYSTISNILVNPVYMGKIKRGFCKQIKSIERGVVKKRIKHFKNPNDYEMFDGLHIPLITEEQFWQAQTIRQKRPAPKVKEEFELKNAFAGLIFCAECGKRIGRVVNKGVPRLRCVNERNCHNGSCKYEIVEKKVIEALRTWLDGYKVKIDTVGFADDISDGKARIEAINQKNEKLKMQLDKAFDLVEQGVYTLEVFVERKEKLNAAIKSNLDEQKEIYETITSLEKSKHCESSLIPKTEKLLASYDKMTVKERNTLLKQILYRIEYKKGADRKVEIDIYPRLPQIR